MVIKCGVDDQTRDAVLKSYMPYQNLTCSSSSCRVNNFTRITIHHTRALEMSVISGVGDFLQYEPEHKVLICKECQYAIQKSALGSHLLRHKIYRGQRQRLLSSIAKLDLLEPEDVRLPSPSSQPVQNLPVVSGYRCVSAGCSSLCASEKRMKRHWSESHNTNINGVLDEIFAQKTLLQTFFRGTKLRYFEVHAATETTSEPDDGATQASASHSVTQRDLSTLRYFHHFISSTSNTLPGFETESRDYWCSRVVAQALQWPWLMSGLLCVATHHLSISPSDGNARAGLEQVSRYSQDFLTALRRFKTDPVVVETDDESVSGVKMGAQLMCIRQLCLWSYELNEPVEDGSSSSLQALTFPSFVAAIRGCASPDLALQTLLEPDEALGSTQSEDKRETHESSESAMMSIPQALAERLRTLPFRMAEPLPRPDSPADFFATVSSLNSLVQCFALSYASEDPQSIWKAMVQWFQMIPDHFARILRRELPSPAALVVLGHWTILVERAERHHWFLKGAALKLMRGITDQLPQDGAIQSLVSDLLS